MSERVSLERVIMYSYCFSELLHNAPMLVIATTGAIIQVNAKTLEPCAYILLEGTVGSIIYLYFHVDLMLNIEQRLLLSLASYSKLFL